MKRSIFVNMVVLLVFCFSNTAYAGWLSGYIVPTTTVVNSTGYILKITQVRSGKSKVVAECSTGEDAIFQTRLENLTIMGNGLRSATYIIKAYNRNTGEFYATGPNIMLIRDNRRHYGTVSYNYVTRVGPRGARTNVYKTYSHRYRYGWSGYRTGYTEDTIVVYVGDGIDPPPIMIYNEDLIPVETNQQPPF